MKILVTGVSGLLGLNAALVMRGDHRVVGAYLDQPVVVPGVDTHRIDISDREAVRRWCERERPDLVWHAAGLTNVDGCESNPALARRLNTDAAVFTAEAAASVGAQLVHVSTDHLFDGTTPNCLETQPPAPLNVYAWTKLHAESGVREVHPQAFIVRTNFYGWGHPKRQSFSDWILGALRRGETLNMFPDVHFTPMLANDLVDVCLDLVARGAPGVYNVAGGERLSKWAFGVAVAEHFGFNADRIASTSVETFAFKARRPHDMSLNTDKVARAVGYPMPGLHAGLDRLGRLERDGWPAMLADALISPQGRRHE